MTTKSKFKDKAIFITGASSGIGASLAEEFVKLGARVTILGRRKDRLEALARRFDPSGHQVLPVVADVTQPAELEAAVAQTRSAFGKIDVVIANAGFGVVGAFEKLTIDDYRRQFETNIFGVLNTVSATLEDLKKSRGAIGIVGSVAGVIPLPNASAYSMSKAAVNAFAEALRAELKPKCVSVTLLSPGFVSSEIRMVDNRGELHATKDPLPSWILVAPDRAAREMIAAIGSRKGERIITGHGKVLVAAKRHFPTLVSWVIGRGIKGRPEPKRR